MTLANIGDGVITLLLTDGSKRTIRPGFWAEVDQDHHGRFVRVVRRGCIVHE